MTNDFGYGLGRVPAPDARDGLFPMRAALGPVQARTGSKVWDESFPSLDQGQNGTCVGHGWKHWLLTAPLVQSKPDTDPLALAIYDRCTEIDEFPANDPVNGQYNLAYGTSTRAGAKVLVEKGLLAEFRSATALSDMVDWLMDKGPLVIGINWYNGMFGPFDGTLARPTGGVAGGHCVCVQGVDNDFQTSQGKGVFLIRNSWGPAWGPWRNGLVHIAFSDMQQLIFGEGGDCIAGLEVALGPTPPPQPTPSGDPSWAQVLAKIDATIATLQGGAAYSSTFYRRKGAEAVRTAVRSLKP